MPQSQAGHGFTLIELLVVMAVMGVLALTVFPMAELSVQRDKERELKRALWEIREAIDAYKKAADAGLIAFNANLETGYPPDLKVLVEGVPSTKVGKLMFLRRLPRDPFSDSRLPAEQTWQVRSYYSSDEKPEAGQDVYDVSSRSVKAGLNGTALKDW